MGAGWPPGAANLIWDDHWEEMLKLVPMEALRHSRIAQMEWMAWFRPGGPSVSFPVGSDATDESRGRTDERRRRMLAAWEVLVVPSVRGHDASTQFGVLDRHARYTIAVRSK